jgi:(heptosyl)LPS beta-1,4-glucosyltransferase
MTRLAAVALTYNEQEHIADCLASLAFADARLVFDSFSTDATVEKAKESGADVIQHTFIDYAKQRNAALEAVRDTADWVLFVDADERPPSAPPSRREMPTRVGASPATTTSSAC